MEFAERFRLPIVIFIDTPGAYPGIGAEERGQAQAIATNLREMVEISTPIIVVVIGEGGSGGALAIGVGDRVYILENSVYSVISPEGCAAILWKKEGAALNQDDYARAADVLRMTSEDLKTFGVVDGVIEEPLGGMHNGSGEAFEPVRRTIRAALEALMPLPAEELLRRRYERLRALGTMGFMAPN